MALELHAQLRQRASAHDGDVAEHAGGDQRPGDHERRHRGGAEVLHVGAGCLAEPGRLGNGLGHVAAAALVAVADGVLRAGDDVVDAVGVDPVVLDEVQECEGSGRLAGEVLEQHGGGECVVGVVCPPEARGQPVPVDVQRQRAVLGRHGLGIAAGCAEPVEVQLLGKGVPGKGGTGEVGDLMVEGDEAELVEAGQEAEELLLGHDLAAGGEAARARARCDPGAPGQVAGVDGADVGLVGQVGDRVVEAAQRPDELRQEFGTPRQRTARLGPVAGETRDVGQHLRAVADDGCVHRVTSSGRRGRRRPRRHGRDKRRVEDRRLVDLGRDRDEGGLQQPAPPGPLRGRVEAGVPGGEGDAPRRHDPRRTDPRRDRHEVHQQRGRDPGPLQLLRKR